jgi:NAD(P)-dependent dehydrogenase (short-subunit alcohol dehydrogenase family)
MDRVKGKVALVTGAASGIGRATASLLAQEGAKVIVSDINVSGGKDTVDEIKNKGGDAIFVRHDVTSEREWNNVIEKAVGTYGKLDVLVNNAGIAPYKSIEDTSLEEWRRVMAVNVEGVFLGTKCAINAMKKTGGGSIINISSVAGIVGFKGSALYCASKGAVRIFTKAAALECSKAGYNYNIRINSVHPGIIDTPLKRALDEVHKGTSTGIDMENAIPIGRVGQPIDIAHAVLFLASDDSEYATGAEFVIDGGWIAN